MTVTYDAIARKAYEIWERRGRPAGCEKEHWYQAERELRAQRMRELESEPLLTDEPSLMRPEEPANPSRQKRGMRPSSPGSPRATRVQARSRV